MRRTILGIMLFCCFSILGCNNYNKHMEAAESYYKNGDKDKAMSELDTAISSNPGKVRAYYLRGMLKLEKQDYQEALYDFKSGCADGPDKNGDMDACNMYLSMRTGTDIQGMINRSLPR